VPPGDDEIPESELEIGGVIGNGAMGVVYRAKWRETDVAVKRLKRSGAANREQLLADFRREVALLKQLRHPHVVLFLGWLLSSSSDLADGGGGGGGSEGGAALCFLTELCWTSLYRLLHDPAVPASALPWARRLAMG
jgi:serine/threonine protein kinase